MKKSISKMRAAAGKAGAAARWGQTPRKTKTIRAYAADIAALASRRSAVNPTTADVIHALLTLISARVTKVIDRGGFLGMNCECHSFGDWTTADFAWPGRVLSSDNGATIDEGWVFIDDAEIKVGDLIPHNLEDVDNA